MKFKCHVQNKSQKKKSSQPVFTDSLLFEEEDENAAYGHKNEKTRTKNQQKECGTKPELIRSCFSAECPNDGENSLECKDSSFHCGLPILQRYCALPKFQVSCCLSCANQ